MASNNYKCNIDDISEYFGVSEKCAQYMYHRAIRSKKKDDKYIQWNIRIQNAIVKADKCLGIEWEKVIFGKESEEFSLHGILIDEMPDDILRWNKSEEELKPDTEWITVAYKKKKIKPKFKFTGIIVQ